MSDNDDVSDCDLRTPPTNLSRGQTDPVASWAKNPATRGERVSAPCPFPTRSMSEQTPDEIDSDNETLFTMFSWSKKDPVPEQKELSVMENSESDRINSSWAGGNKAPKIHRLGKSLRDSKPVVTARKRSKSKDFLDTATTNSTSRSSGRSKTKERENRDESKGKSKSKSSSRKSKSRSSRSVDPFDLVDRMLSKSLLSHHHNTNRSKSVSNHNRLKSSTCVDELDDNFVPTRRTDAIDTNGIREASRHRRTKISSDDGEGTVRSSRTSKSSSTKVKRSKSADEFDLNDSILLKSSSNKVPSGSKSVDPPDGVSGFIKHEPTTNDSRRSTTIDPAFDPSFFENKGLKRNKSVDMCDEFFTRGNLFTPSAPTRHESFDDSASRTSTKSSVSRSTTSYFSGLTRSRSSRLQPVSSRSSKMSNGIPDSMSVSRSTPTLRNNVDMMDDAHHSGNSKNVQFDPPSHSRLSDRNKPRYFKNDLLFEDVIHEESRHHSSKKTNSTSLEHPATTERKNSSSKGSEHGHTITEKHLTSKTKSKSSTKKSSASKDAFDDRVREALSRTKSSKSSSGDKSVGKKKHRDDDDKDLLPKVPFPISQSAPMLRNTTGSLATLAGNSRNITFDVMKSSQMSERKKMSRGSKNELRSEGVIQDEYHQSPHISHSSNDLLDRAKREKKSSSSSDHSRAIKGPEHSCSTTVGRRSSKSKTAKDTRSHRMSPKRSSPTRYPFEDRLGQAGARSKFSQSGNSDEVISKQKHRDEDEVELLPKVMAVDLRDLMANVYLEVDTPVSRDPNDEFERIYEDEVQGYLWKH